MPHTSAKFWPKDNVVWIEHLVGWFAEAANALAFAQLVAAFVTAAATFALWRVTRVLAVETKTLAAMTSNPFVVGSFEPSVADGGAFDVVLRNTGNATAFDIELKFSPPLPHPLDEDENATETVFKVSLLGPGQSLPLLGVQAVQAPDTKFKVSVSWSASPTSSNRTPLTYETRIFSGITCGWSTKGLHQIAEELEKLRKQLPKQ